MQLFFEEGGGRRGWMNCEPISSQMNRLYLLVLLLCFGGELVHSATFTVVNKCPRTIWPGVATNSGVGDPMGTTGFQLAPGSKRVLKAPARWGGRLWARTGCTFDGLGRGNCTTGDCGSNQIECNGTGAAPPVTLAEFQLDAVDGKDFYDVSLVNGYNIPMLVEANGGRGSCKAIGCTADINQTCPNELKLAKGDGCLSACSKFKIPELCCSGQYGSPNTCQPTVYSKVFKSACPSAYSYPFDDASSTFSCTGADFTVTFCALSVPRDSSNNATAPSHAPSTGNSSNNAAPNHAPWTGSATQQSNKKRKVTRAIVLSLVSGILLFSCMGCFLWRRKKKWSGRNFFRDQSNEMDREKDMEIPTFDFSTIAAATDNFSDRNKLGQGGFGPVYKGKLGEEQEVAVKRLSKTSQQGVNEFKNEVLLIAKLQHINLVRLLGCCIQGEEQMLIYEYMVNKSLDAFLFDREKAALLDWKTRYQIITGITRGLLYLHHDSRFRIIHRDLKASNILLDKDLNPKISDFGMARIFGGDETDFNTRKIVGTYGYMSPEYALDGVFSMKSDVFSFGVLVLEIISGKKNRGLYAYDSHLNLVAHAWSLWNEGRSLQLVDESISHSVQMNEVLKCIKIGLLCVQEHAEDRPLMSTVIQMMGSDISSLPQPNKPGFVARNDILEANQYPTKQEPCTNGITVTMLEGR